MPSAVAAAFAAHWTALKSRYGETVTYSSGSASVQLTAVLSQPKADQVATEESIVLESRPWTWLIDPIWPSSAPAAFATLEPSQGDTITRADGTIYQVQPSSTNGPCWRFSDGQNSFRRVYVQER